MRLKKLEIAGFKSFRDKVVLDFSEGISAVVGPNGCGKSNVVDAIRWVMGEQRLKMLRGKKTDDVIFNGSDGASPVGMAEVSMTLGSDDGRPFPGDYAECTEVTVGRKLFRDGESEYTLNRIPCRMLDVKEFFMDTGVGARTYSLVEQNSVAGLVEAKPEDRRQFIEEAAGVAKYKSRKESAIRKMEATRQNMVRVNDIIREVKSQLNALSRQAKRAEQYRELKKGIREAELILSLHVYADLSEKKEALGKSLAAGEAKELEVRTKIKGLEASLEQAKAELLENEGHLSGAQERLFAIRSDINAKEQGIAFLKNKIDDLASQKVRTKLEIERLQEQVESSTTEMEALRTASGESEGVILAAEEAVSGLQASIANLRTLDRNTHRLLEEKKVQYIDVVTRKANLKNMLTSLNRGIEDIRKKEERDIKEADEQKNRLAEVAGIREELEQNLARDESSLDDLIIRKGDAADELDRSKTDLQEIEEKISEIKEASGGKSARLQSLREFHEGYTWCNEATKVLMSARKLEGFDGLSRDDFLGLVADHLDVPKEYETAVEAVLGDRLQYILVKSQKQGVKAIDYLRSSALGRCSFVPLEVRYHSGGTASGEHLQEAVRLVDVVKTKENFRDVAHSLLGDVLLIPNLDSGIALWKQNGFMGTFVTPDGDIISPEGVLTGGSKTNGERSLLGNKREIHELDDEIKGLAASLESVTETRQQAGALIARWEEEVVQFRSQIHRLEIQINSRKKDSERFEDEAKRLQQRLRLLALNRENTLSEINEALEKKASTQKDLNDIEQEETTLNETMSALQQEWTTLRADLEKMEGDLTGKKVLLASWQEKREANIKTIERLEVSINQMGAELASRIAETQTGDTGVQELTLQIAADEEALRTLYGELETLESSLSGMKDRHHQKEDTIREMETRIKGAGKELDETSGDSREMEVQFREASFQIDSLQESLRERDYANIDLDVENFDRLDEAGILDLKQRLQKDRQTVEAFGEVNLLALDEYQQHNERYEFLSSQASDLNTSITTLQKTISRINLISRKRFAETFEAVNICFKDVFSRLFPGGRGELQLTDESDMLETGVEIDIQIPGKRAQNITLLSGGEKSLVAIALIFSIILHRPSPFLVLDEADAALDDANISLFNNLIKDISANSQILMITHNKRSMEVASRLYGITMQQQGISTAVSVNLQ